MSAESQKNITAVCAVSGAVLVITGIALRSIPAALITTGVFLLALAYIPRRGK